MRTSFSTRSASSSAASPSGDARAPVRSSTSGGFHMAIRRSAARGAVAVHQRHVAAGEPLRQLHRVGDRGAGQHESGLGAVGQRQPPQPAQHVGHVRPEHPAVDVRLVHHDPGEVGQQVAPASVVGQHAHVQHVRVGEDQVGAPPDRAALLARRVAVVDRGPQRTQAQAVQRARLVLGQRLGGIEVERAGGGIAAERVQNGQVECQRLAAGGAGGHDRVALERRLQRIGLVGEQGLHARAVKRRRGGRDAAPRAAAR